MVQARTLIDMGLNAVVGVLVGDVAVAVLSVIRKLRPSPAVTL